MNQIAGLLLAATLAAGGELEKVLYIYTNTRTCSHCRVLEKDIEGGKLAGFKIVRIQPVGNMSIPCIAYWKKDGKPAYFTGWSMGSDKAFLKQWKRDHE